MWQFTITDDQLSDIIDSLDNKGGVSIKRTELKYWIEHYVNKIFREDLVFNVFSAPCHAEYTDGECPGVFVKIKDGVLVCNECMIPIKEVLNELLDGIPEGD